MSDQSGRGFDPVTSAYRALQQTGQLHTITFKYPKALATALNRSVDQEGQATHQQIETWIRDVVAMNIEAMLQEHAPEALPRPAKPLKARIRK